ncbi:pyrroloquinoline quinone biosynthesis protein PqqB [Haematococcus lacustris]|uniref:Pyrroloquinoline quinone biosynthesis protein PqqB n=1 Tax=Haematococcus lacustris TaxID=44745 RepID=A0A699ZSM6_HAELA|nr:pyrroloquinoline quinone biosynthesis protein PqqB [Haematococcus lacustris]
MALVDTSSQRFWLLDCGPDIKAQPWKGMVAHGTFDLCEVTPDTPVLLTDQLSATPWLVPHSSSTGTPQGRVKRHGGLVCARSGATAVAELQHRDMRAIPHPVVLDTVSRLALQPGLARRTVLVHLNHSNPLWSKDGAERREVEALGMRVGAAGMQWQL